LNGVQLGCEPVKHERRLFDLLASEMRRVNSNKITKKRDLLPKDLAVSNLMEFRRKYNHLKALEKLTSKSGKHFIQKCFFKMLNMQNLRFFYKILKNINFQRAQGHL
jgi:hypothetical protein